MATLTDKNATVPGGTRGIGRAIVEAFAKAGAKVAFTYRSSDAAAEELKTALEASGTEVLLFKGDAASMASAESTVKGVLDAWGRIDVLVNNAGLLWDGNVFDDMDRFEATMDVSLHGPFSLIRAALPAMKSAGYGRVVNVSSGWGSFSEGLGGGGAYGIGKAAMNALTVIGDGDTPNYIKINARCPGWVKTRMGGAGATRHPEEAADTAIWLATLPDNGPSGGFFRDRKPIEW